jgi:hypothetical protein
MLYLARCKNLIAQRELKKSGKDTFVQTVHGRERWGRLKRATER